ncbi:hypothetical protein LPUS_02800 [Lasallia pustulata]|uniref:Uncharacterized protein n=1 Tax=Lasallia pustulata TaxID=136370 RepID=A0A1W5CTD1_9LECA|nr:hypothetical protein LPUS_02800 [Lasallia pustulata]
MALSPLAGQVRQHLLDVAEDPSKALDEKLLDTFNAQVTVSDSLEQGDRDSIINTLSQLLPTLQQDPSPATTLIGNLIRSPSYSFSSVLAINPPVDFVAGLRAPSPPINSAAILLLSKAAKEPSDAALVAGKPEQAANVLKGLLEVDYAPHILGEAHDVEAITDKPTNEPPGQGLMWRRVFDDRDIYASVFAICSLSTVGHAGQPNKREKTIAQARLLEFLLALRPRVADTWSSSHFPEVEAAYGVRDGGLLHFAAEHMVDYKDDVLMHMTLIDFFAGLLQTGNAGFLSYTTNSISMTRDSTSSPTLDFLISRGLHSRSMSFYLEPSKHDSLDLTYLYSRSANYISVYATNYATHLLNASSSVADAILARLSSVLNGVSSGHWAHGNAPKHDLHVVASLPRVCLVPQTRESTPLFLIPAKPANADALHTLAAVFRGPLVASAISKTSSNRPVFETSTNDPEAARTLYFLYLRQHPAFWTHVVNAAEAVALKDNALAAVELMSAVIGANWHPLPHVSEESSSQSPYLLPTESELADMCGSPNQQLPPSGVLAILASPALEVVLPYLLRPAQTFSNLVGGRGDTESAAYRVAVAKHDALILLHQKLKDVAQETTGLEEIVTAVGRRVTQGPMGGSSDVGGRIGTLEW